MKQYVLRATDCDGNFHPAWNNPEYLTHPSQLEIDVEDWVESGYEFDWTGPLSAELRYECCSAKPDIIHFELEEGEVTT